MLPTVVVSITKSCTKYEHTRVGHSEQQREKGLSIRVFVVIKMTLALTTTSKTCPSSLSLWLVDVVNLASAYLVYWDVVCAERSLDLTISECATLASVHWHLFVTYMLFVSHQDIQTLCTCWSKAPLW